MNDLPLKQIQRPGWVHGRTYFGKKLGVVQLAIWNGEAGGWWVHQIEHPWVQAENRWVDKVKTLALGSNYFEEVYELDFTADKPKHVYILTCHHANRVFRPIALGVFESLKQACEFDVGKLHDNQYIVTKSVLGGSMVAGCWEIQYATREVIDVDTDVYYTFDEV